MENNRRMKKRSLFFYLLIIPSFLLVMTGCGKQKCGCDGKEQFTLSDQAGTLYYDSDTKYSYFISDGIYSYFTICDPDVCWDQITQFDSGDKVWITGSVSDDCMKQVSGYYYANYVLRVDEIREPEF